MQVSRRGMRVHSVESRDQAWSFGGWQLGDERWVTEDGGYDESPDDGLASDGDHRIDLYSEENKLPTASLGIRFGERE